MNENHHEHAPSCLLRFLEAHQERELGEIALARRARGDRDGAELFFLFANHRAELMNDLRAGSALRTIERRDMSAVRRTEASIAAQPDSKRGRWGVGVPERQIAAYGDTLEGALRNFDEAMLFVPPREPGRN